VPTNQIQHANDANVQDDAGPLLEADNDIQLGSLLSTTLDNPASAASSSQSEQPSANAETSSTAAAPAGRNPSTPAASLELYDGNEGLETASVDLASHLSMTGEDNAREEEEAASAEK